MHRHDLVAALTHIRRSVRIAERAGLDTRAGQARISLAGALAVQGNLRAALTEADRAAAVLHGRDLARLNAQRAFIFDRSGQRSRALESYTKALPALRKAGDTRSEAVVLHNRGLAHAHLGAFATAQADLLRAEQLLDGLGDDLGVAEVRVNLGWVAARQGDIPTALARFDQADECFRQQQHVNPAALFDRCEALLAANLGEEARTTAQEATDRLARAGEGSLLAEAGLKLSEACLLCGDVEAALTAADTARRAFSRQGRASFVALARYAWVRAAWAGGERTPALLVAARRAADTLADTGWTIAALDARLIAARLALDTGRVTVARRQLAYTSGRLRGPATLRSRVWLGRALLRLADGDRRGAEAALRAGMRVLDTHRAVLGATELRAHSSAHAADLAGLGLRLALEDANPARALRWAERWRASSLQLRPVRPPVDAALGDDLAKLRQVLADLAQAPATGRDTGRLLTRQASLEESVRRRARTAAGTKLYQAAPSPTVAAYRAALGDRALVELVTLDGELYAIVIAGGPPRLRALGPVSAPLSQLEHLRFALRRLTAGHGSERSRRAAGESMRHAAATLDSLLLEPLEHDLGRRELVIVPTGALHALPWAALPSCAGRPVSVTPAAAFWYRATVRPPPTAPTDDRRVVLVAGPGLAGAESEVAELQSSYPGSRCLIAADARAEAVATALDGADLAHVAAHGRFRADNPLFSSLEMADGPLTVYDLEALSQAPANLVLSACDSAVSEVCPGDDLMGLAAALLALGSRSLIASVLPVDDALTRPLMIALHQELRTGAPPATALARAQARLPRRRVSRGHGVGVRLSRVGIGVALAVVATTVAACGRTSTSIPPGTVVYAVGGTLDGFNVNTGKDSNEAARDVAVNTFFYAVKVAPDFTLTFPGLEGGAAPRVVSTNPQVVEWVIRRQAVWSDGTPVTSEDLRYFHEQVMDPENDVATQVGYKQITNLEVVNDKTIRATFDPAYSEFQSLWTSVPQAAFMKAAPGGWNKGLNDEPGPSAGPYVVNTKLFVRGESLVLEPNPKWWGDPRPGIKSIVFRFISEGSQVEALKNGEVNLIAPAPAPDLVSTLKGLSDVRTDLAPSPEWPQLLFNPANPILAEPSVRRAIAHAVDRDAIVDLAVRPMMGSAAKLDSLDSFVYLPNQPGYEAHGAEYAHADAAMARKLLDEADWVPRRRRRAGESRPGAVTEVVHVLRRLARTGAGARPQRPGSGWLRRPCRQLRAHVRRQPEAEAGRLRYGPTHLGRRRLPVDHGAVHLRHRGKSQLRQVLERQLRRAHRRGSRDGRPGRGGEAGQRGRQGPVGGAARAAALPAADLAGRAQRLHRHRRQQRRRWSALELCRLGRRPQR